VHDDDVEALCAAVHDLWKKLEAEPAATVHPLTEPWVGYCWQRIPVDRARRGQQPSANRRVLGRTTSS
jgi:hypothetical protein